MTREQKLLNALVALADTLVRDYDVTEFLYDLCVRTHELFDVDGVGVLLAGEGLELAAASTDEMQEIELFELQESEGPCFDSYRFGEQVTAEDLSTVSGKWGTFVAKAQEAGFSAVYAFPLRLRGDRVGAMNLLRRQPGPLDDEDLQAAQALADVATIGILQQRAVADAQRLSGQLQYALDSRVCIEQAKGILAQSLDTTVRKAFDVMRAHARTSSRRLVDVCAEVIDGRSQLLPGDARDLT